jgi:hypothetical protein
MRLHITIEVREKHVCGEHGPAGARPRGRDERFRCQVRQREVRVRGRSVRVSRRTKHIRGPSDRVAGPAASRRQMVGVGSASRFRQTAGR